MYRLAERRKANLLGRGGLMAAPPPVQVTRIAICIRASFFPIAPGSSL